MWTKLCRMNSYITCRSVCRTIHVLTESYDIYKAVEIPIFSKLLIGYTSSKDTCLCEDFLLVPLSRSNCLTRWQLVTDARALLNTYLVDINFCITIIVVVVVVIIIFGSMWTNWQEVIYVIYGDFNWTRYLWSLKSCQV